MFDNSSRYFRTPTYCTVDQERSSVAIDGVEARLPVVNVFKRVHRVAGSDRLDNLANRFYADPRRYWLIADAHDDLFPCDLTTPGRVLRIPRDTGD